MSTLLNCRKACDQAWEDLANVEGQRDVRYCSRCETCVFWCDDEDTLKQRVIEGRCIATTKNLAMNHGLPHSEAGFVGGQISAPYLYPVK